MAELPVTDILVGRVRRGDRTALEQLYRTLELPVYTLARRLCRHPQDAEDVVQETFMEVFRSIHRYRGEGPLEGWVRRITASKALMHLRTRSRRSGEEPFPEEDGPSAVRTPPAPLPARLDLESALERLSDTARAVVWLHDVEGYTHEEIADLMARTPSFSKSQLARAHARLREWLAWKGEVKTCTQA